MLLKKVTNIGESRAIIIPAAYFRYWRTKGVDVNEFLMEVDEDGRLVLAPVTQ